MTPCRQWLALAILVFALVSLSVAQNCATDQNPYCAGNSIFEQICCPYPNVCYWQNRDGAPGCCPAGTVCDGTSPYYPPTPIPAPTTRTSTIRVSTITITPTPTTPGGGGGVIIITTVPNGPSVITITTYPGVCGGVCATVTSGAGGVYSTVTSVVGGGFSTITSGAASVYSSVSGVLVGVPSAATPSVILPAPVVIGLATLAAVWNTFG